MCVSLITTQAAVWYDGQDRSHLERNLPLQLGTSHFQTLSLFPQTGGDESAILFLTETYCEEQASV